MNKIAEEAMTNIIRRIEILESQVNELRKNINKKKTTNENVNMDSASEAQIDYLRSLGGKAWEGMSKKEAGKGIDNCLLNKKMSEVVEPKEVYTDDAGLDAGDLL